MLKKAIALSLEEEKEEELCSIKGELFKNKMTSSNQTSFTICR